MSIKKPGQLVGILLLMVVNIIWVASSELTKYLFIDLDFKRPFFTTYVKSCMFTLFILRYVCTTTPSTLSKLSHFVESNYSNLQERLSDDEENETDEYEAESLTTAEFEPVNLTTSDSEVDLTTTLQNSLNTEEDEETLEFSLNSFKTNAALLKREKHQQYGDSKGRKVRFSAFREIRKLPEAVAHDAKLARLPYKSDSCICVSATLAFNYAVYFAPLWFLTSTSYQVALVYSTVSSVNLISASSSLFVLVLGSIFGNRSSDRFTYSKLFFVLLNFTGVAVVSQYSTSWLGSFFSLLSALSNAAYLLAFSVYTIKWGKVDMNLMFGLIGLFSLIVCTPLIILLHIMDIEPQLPAPTGRQFGIVVFNGIVGSLFADYLWLYATLLTNSLISSLSMTLSIPMAMLADSIFRNQPPDFIQLAASIPILISFVGAVLINAKTITKSNVSSNAEKQKNEDNSSLLSMGKNSTRIASKITYSFSDKNERKSLMNSTEPYNENEEV